MRLGLDYAWTTIAPAAHKAVGSSFACRYLSHDATKNLSLGEAHALRTGGIDVVAIWESTASRALAGHGAGAQDARDALAQARACGLPEGRPIYFAVDFDESPAQAAAVADYFAGINGILGVAHTGAYGGYWVIKRLFDARLISYGWQTYAWSGGSLDLRACLYQYSNGHRVAGQDCDYNHALKPDFGQFGYAAPPLPQPASGVAAATVRFDLGKGGWSVSPAPGKVHFGPQDRWASAELQINTRTGQWRVRALPWNAPPLG